MKHALDLDVIHRGDPAVGFGLDDEVPAALVGGKAEVPVLAGNAIFRL